jgi:hypothetical protein
MKTSSQIFLLTAFLLAAFAPGFGQSEWIIRNPLPADENNLSAVCRARNNYVVVGSQGTIMTSGSRWAPIPFSLPVMG